jgi:hypothetical protein
MSRRAEQKQDREFRNRSGIPGEVGWGIRNPNAEFAGSIDVDLLIPVAGRLDELELWAGFEATRDRHIPWREAHRNRMQVRPCHQSTQLLHGVPVLYETFSEAPM